MFTLMSSQFSSSSSTELKLTELVVDRVEVVVLPFLYGGFLCASFVLSWWFGPYEPSLAPRDALLG